jgi:hypothetical protein
MENKHKNREMEIYKNIKIDFIKSNQVIKFTACREEIL